MVGLGVLQPKFLEQVPGTATLLEGSATHGGVEAQETARLKHGKGKDSNIVLVPQPSDSPRDPLNWPTWKRELCFFTLLGTTVWAGSLGPILTEAGFALTLDFHTTFTKVAQLTGWQLCGEAAIGLFLAAGSNKFGKRSVYLASASFLFVGTIWAAAAKDYNSLDAARLVQGFGIAAYEVLVPASIGDLYFVHQRGHRIALWVIALMSGTFFCPIIAGVVDFNLGWRWMFGIPAIIFFPLYVMTILFVPEHAYNRDHLYETDETSVDNLNVLADVEHARDKGLDTTAINENEKALALTATQEELVRVRSGSQEKPKTFWQELKPFSGTYSNINVLKLFVRPIPLMIYPAAMYLYLLQGTMQAWTIGISIVLAQIFSAPPYNFDSKATGYIYVGPMIAVVLAYLFTGYSSDMIAKWMAKRNNNIYEPEFRLLLAIPVFIFGVAGFFGFGNAIQKGASWQVCVFAWSVSNFATIICLNVTGAYLIDGHRALRNELFISCLLFKNFFVFGETYFFNNWLTSAGPAKMFNTIGGIHIAVCALTIPMYLFGKYSRAYLHKADILRKLRLD